MALTKIKADGLTADLIDETKLADNSIDSEHYNDGSIDNAHLADDAVGVAELSATGTASSSTFLRGDNSWTAVNTDLVSDTSPQLGGDLDTNSFEISLDDSHNVIFGDGDDFKIRFDGTNSIVEHIPASGYLGLQSDDLYLQDNTNGHVYARCIRDAQVELYYDNTKKFETTAAGCKISTGVLDFFDDIEARFGSGGDFKIYHNATDTYLNNGTGNFRIGNNHANNIKFFTNNSTRWNINSDGHFLPDSNNSFDIGTSTYRVRNIYTNDLNLSNEGGANNVDGTWGDWTIQEGESDLFLKNNRSGKKYKFNLTEVS